MSGLRHVSCQLENPNEHARKLANKSPQTLIRVNSEQPPGLFGKIRKLIRV